MMMCLVTLGAIGSEFVKGAEGKLWHREQIIYMLALFPGTPEPNLRGAGWMKSPGDRGIRSRDKPTTGNYRRPTPGGWVGTLQSALPNTEVTTHRHFQTWKRQPLPTAVVCGGQLALELANSAHPTRQP